MKKKKIDDGKLPLPKDFVKITGLSGFGGVWISVKDKLPKYKDNVLLFGKFCGRPDAFRIGYRSHTDENGDIFLTGENQTIIVTHWQPLTKPII